MLQDVLRGGRNLSRHPRVFTLVIATMAVGIACLTAVFSVVYGVLLEPLPYPWAGELVSVESVHPQRGRNLLWRVEAFDAFRRESRAISELAAVEVAHLQVRTGAVPRASTALLATPSVFPLLGARARRGRLFRPGEGHFGEERVAILSHAFWKSELGGDAAVVGRPLRFAGDPALGGLPGQEGAFTVVGVLPRGFRAPFGNLDPDVWIADSFDRRTGAPAPRVMVFGRLAEGVSREVAEEELGGIARRLQATAGEEGSPWRTRLVPLRELLVGPLRRPLELLFLGGLILLVVAAANTANLLLARAEARTSETVVRRSLGAAWGHLLGQLAAESLVPAVLAGGFGLAAAWGLLRLFRSLEPGWIPRRFDVGLDPVVLAVVAGVTLATLVLFAATPVARLLRLPLSTSLEGRGTGGRRSFGLGRFGLVGFQVALAVALAVASSLLVESAHHLESIDPGFTREGAWTGWISLPEASYPDARSRRSFYRRLLIRVGALPGVVAAGLVDHLPFSGGSAATEITIEDPAPGGAGSTFEIQLRAITPGYLEAMGIPRLAGRRFAAGDLERPVVIVSRAAARRLWGESDPLGRRVELRGGPSSNPPAEVVGMVGDVQQTSLTEPRQPTLYVPFLSPARMALVVRGAGGRPGLLTPGVRRELAELDPGLALGDVRSLAARVRTASSGVRLSAWLITLLAVVTLLLATIGVYGATEQAVVERRQEIGIRCALGAAKADVLRLVFRRVGPWLAGGLVGGALAALALGRSLSSLLFGVGSTDPVVFLLTAATVATAALVGTYLPTRKASRLDPAVSVRSGSGSRSGGG